MATNFAAGFQRLIDQQQRLTRDAHPIYLRIRVFPDQQNQLYAQLGFSTVTSDGNPGTLDIPIDPPASSQPVSMHNIGQSMGKLRFGARHFFVSASFVDQQVINQVLSNQDLVWRGPQVIGLVVDGSLWEIVSSTHRELAGKTVMWTITAQALETR